MITYQEIYDMLRKEKYNEVLQPLPKKFLKEVASYIDEKKNILGREDTGKKGLFSETVRMTRKQLDNTMAIIKELTIIRQRKILNLALTAAMTGVSKKDTENLLKYEIELFELTTKQLENCQKEITKKLKGQEEEKPKNILIRFKEDTPAFLGGEGHQLGPFKQNDVVNLPSQIASILISDGKAAQIEE